MRTVVALLVLILVSGCAGLNDQGLGTEEKDIGYLFCLGACYRMRADQIQKDFGDKVSFEAEVVEEPEPGKKRVDLRQKK